MAGWLFKIFKLYVLPVLVYRKVLNLSDPCSISMKAYSSRKLAVTTTQKSQATMAKVNVATIFADYSRTFSNISPRIVINPGPKRTYVDDGPKSSRAGTITCPEISTIRCPASLSN